MDSTQLQMLPLKHDKNRVLIASLFCKGAASATTIMWFCGFKSNMRSVKAEALAEWTAKHSLGYLRFDYSGHGQSSGAFEDGTITKWLDEAYAVYSAYPIKHRFVMVGSSMGAWIAMLLNRVLVTKGHQAADAIVMIAPAWDMTQLMWDRGSEAARTQLIEKGVVYQPSAYNDEPYPITRALIEDGKHHLFKENAIEINASIRILHGMQDADIPWQRSLHLTDRLTSQDIRLSLIKDGNHGLSRPQDQDLLFSTISEVALF